MQTPAPRSHRSVVLLVSLAPLLANADAGLVVLALPDLRRDLSMSLTEAHWVTNVYVVLVGALQLLGGRLCDRYGARRLFLGALTAFAVASLLCAAAPTGAALLSARAGQAVAAAVLVPAAMCLLLTTVRGEAQRRGALARWAAYGGAGSVAGVLAGGLAAGHLGWRWAFLLNVPIALGALPAGRRLPADAPRPRHGALDVPGALLLTGALLSLVHALVGIADHGFGPVTWVSFAVATVLFVRRQARAADPLLPVSVLRDRALMAGALGIVFVAAATGPVVFVGSLYLREARGYGAWPAACALLPVVGGVLVTGRWCARWVGRLGPRTPFLAGCGLTGSGLVLLTSLSPGSSYATGLLPGLVLVGAGLPVLWMACEIASVSAVGRDVLGTAAGVVQCAGQTGAALGLAVAVTVYGGGNAQGGPAAAAAGAARAFWVCAAVLACAALTLHVGLRSRRRAAAGRVMRPAATAGPPTSRPSPQGAERRPRPGTAAARPGREVPAEGGRPGCP